MFNPVAILLTRFIYCDTNGNEYRPAWGYTLDEDFHSSFYDGYESLAEVVDALSPKNLLDTVGRHTPDFLSGIDREGGLMLDNTWVDIDDLATEPASENGR
jgi:hypothetical protein